MANRDHIEGELGEQKVHKYFDANIGSIITFPNAKSKQNAQIADSFLWLNRKALLVEVKTRVTSAMPLDLWVHDRVIGAIEQRIKGYTKCVKGEEIYLHNDYYHVKFDSNNVSFYMGLIVLNYEGKSNILPSTVAPEIYKSPLPIQVISYDDLAFLSEEIDTFNDLWYYLKDRYNYVKEQDIPIGCERDIVGLYKLNENSFPKQAAITPESSHWDNYSDSMGSAIERRNSHNKRSLLIDSLETFFKDQRKQADNVPLGLLFAWEIGALSRRERAIIGEKIDSAQIRFENGGNRRYFSFLNPSTGNWLIFLFSNNDKSQVSIDTDQYAWLKLIKEIHFRQFEYGVYGFGFQVSRTLPFRLLGLVKVTVMGSNKGIQYTDVDIKAAVDLWGADLHGAPIKIAEFPDEEKSDL